MAQGKHQVVVTLATGTLTEIPQDSILGFQAQLEYDTEVFDAVKFEASTGWNAPVYDNTTKKLIVDGSSAAKANTSILKIVLDVKEGVKSQKTQIALKQILFANEDTSINVANQTIEVNIVEVSDNQNAVNNTTTGKNNTIDVTATGNKVVSNNTTTTGATTKTSLPKAGIIDVAVWGVVILTIISIVSYLRYRTIKIK